MLNEFCLFDGLVSSDKIQNMVRMEKHIDITMFWMGDRLVEIKSNGIIYVSLVLLIFSKQFIEYQ